MNFFVLKKHFLQSKTRSPTLKNRSFPTKCWRGTESLSEVRASDNRPNSARADLPLLIKEAEFRVSDQVRTQRGLHAQAKHTRLLFLSPRMAWGARHLQELLPGELGLILDLPGFFQDGPPGFLPPGAC